MKTLSQSISAAALFGLLAGCGSQPIDGSMDEQAQASPEAIETSMASVEAVEITESESQYLFSVTVRSPDTGCDRYANWWEVITEDGTLLYRRILAHSHVDEQPFTRSGGFSKTDIDANEPIIVRVHMEPDGYSNLAMSGRVGEALEPTTLSPDFALALAEADPQPAGCGF